MQIKNLQPNPLFAAAYLRCRSCHESDFYTLDVQRHQIETRANQDGLTLVKFYSESGPNNLQRPAIDQLMADAQKGNFAILYVDTLRRIDRRLERVTNLAKRLHEANVSLVSIGEGFDMRNVDTRLRFFSFMSVSEQLRIFCYSNQQRPERN
ncbi:MAG: recombinase family protein [Chloroflexi bacterium]|nr:recombinase family protein [Chloroflexota bacterium]